MEKWLSVKIPLKQLTATVFRQGLQEMLLRLVGFQCCQEGADERSFSPSPSGGENGAGPTRGASEAGRLITKSRRWWRKAAFPGTCQSTKGQVCG